MPGDYDPYDGATTPEERAMAAQIAGRFAAIRAKRAAEEAAGKLRCDNAPNKEGGRRVGKAAATRRGVSTRPDY